MTRVEALELCRRNAAEHPDRSEAQWQPKEREDGTWTVIRIGLPPTAPTATETRADERPPTPDDPRPDIPNTIGPTIF